MMSSQQVSKWIIIEHQHTNGTVLEEPREVITKYGNSTGEI